MAEIIGLPYEKRPFCKLAGEDGNAYFIMARVRRALLDAGLKEAAEAYDKEAKSGDYDHLLAVSMSYVRHHSDDEDEEDEDADDDTCDECGEEYDEHGYCGCDDD